MKQNILVVDDEAQILAALKRTLRNQEYNVLTANDGTEALAILEETQVSLIVSDYMMPGLSGTELLTKAEEIQPDSVRIILSGHSDFQNVMDSIKSGTVHKFLAKPWSNEVLIKQINKSLGLGEDSEEKKEVSEPASEKIRESKAKDNSLNFYDLKATLDNQIVSIAPELIPFFDYSMEELEGKDFSILLAEHSYQQHSSYVERKVKTAKKWSVSAQARIAKTRNNAFFPIALGMKKTANEIVYAIAALDTIKLKLPSTEKVLKEINDAYLLIDENGKIVKFNQKLSDLFGSVLTLKVDVTLTNFLHDCFENGFFPKAQFDQSEWLEAFLKLDQEREYELQGDQNILVQPIKTEEGNTLLVHKVKDLDIEKVLDKALLDAKQAIQEKAEILNRLNKEISVPIENRVLIPLSKLKETNLDETQQEYLNLALDSSRSILSAILNITGFNVTDKTDKLDAEKQTKAQ